MKCCVIIVAGGKGTRMGAECAKQFLELNGKAILALTLDKFENNENINDIIVVIGKDEKEYLENNILKKYKYKKITAIIKGGKERQNSVHNGLKAVSPNNDIVLVHDGVRPFINQKDINNIINATIEKKACVLAVQVKDTTKYVNEHGIIEKTLDRNKLWAIQTPQAFRYDILLKAYEFAEKNNIVATDDASLVEMIEKVHIVEGSYKNIKITTKEDLDYGSTLIKRNDKI